MFLLDAVAAYLMDKVVAYFGIYLSHGVPFVSAKNVHFSKDYRKNRCGTGKHCMSFTHRSLGNLFGQVFVCHTHNKYVFLLNDAMVQPPMG